MPSVGKTLNTATFNVPRLADEVTFFNEVTKTGAESHRVLRAVLDWQAAYADDDRLEDYREFEKEVRTKHKLSGNAGDFIVWTRETIGVETQESGDVWVRIDGQDRLGMVEFDPETKHWVFYPETKGVRGLPAEAYPLYRSNGDSLEEQDLKIMLEKIVDVLLDPAPRH